MPQGAWGSMDGPMQPGMHQFPGGPDPSRLAPNPLDHQPQNQQPVSLSAQAELELELSLRGSLLVQQQRRIVQLEDELQRAWTEIDRLRTKISSVERDRLRGDDDQSKQQPRYWTPEEHRLFMEAVGKFGWKDVKAISQAVGTRTPTQVRTHAQKLFLRQQKESQGDSCQGLLTSSDPSGGGMLPNKSGGGKDLLALGEEDDAEHGIMGGLQEAAYLAQLRDADGADFGHGNVDHGGDLD